MGAPKKAPTAGALPAIVLLPNVGSGGEPEGKGHIVSNLCWTVVAVTHSWLLSDDHPG